ncbi:BET1 homolog isoform X2 [Clavelina lepadiformis]|uniref:t-SNARE coiled-coil homology domain-containing protein n=1 Tax=Clavelina lepadiformis TaxID=159417 RepID=A0ABP0FRF5_CLALP
MRRAHAGEQSVYEEENQKMEEELRHKVTALKAISINIGEEVRGQNKMLKDMDDDMSKVGGFLGSTMNKLKQISRGGYGKMYLYLALFTFAVFFVMYFLIRLS